MIQTKMQINGVSLTGKDQKFRLYLKMDDKSEAKSS